MKLTDLDAKFLKLTVPEEGCSVYRTDALFAEADGIIFLCPKCFDTNNGEVGTHSVICWFTGKVPDDLSPKPGRWNPQGTSIDDLTFVGPGAVSVQLLGGCNWHGFVVNGSAS
jgi:hypothetical protein